MRILLLDAGFNQTAYLIAELSRSGVEVVVASPGSPDPNGLGRYCRQIQSPPIEDPGYAGFIMDLLVAQKVDLILPLCEPIQQLVWALPSEAGGRVFPETTALQRSLLQDRRMLYHFVSQLGVPVPRAESIAAEEQLDVLVAKFGLPCVLRGTQGMSGEQVKILAKQDQVHAAYRDILSRSPAPPFVQEYLSGPRCLIGGLFDHGRPLQWFSQRAIEVSPPPAGPAIRVQSLADPALRAAADRIFRALEWDGMACAEFIQVAAHEYRFLEINPRPWAAIRAAHTCGIPLLRQFAEYLQGRRPSSMRELADGIECTLFPAFLTARIRAGRFPRSADLKAYWQCLRAAPLTQPSLMRHFLKVILWTYDAAQKDRQ